MEESSSPPFGLPIPDIGMPDEDGMDSFEVWKLAEGGTPSRWLALFSDHNAGFNVDLSRTLRP